jgi:hypothetical protein
MPAASYMHGLPAVLPMVSAWLPPLLGFPYYPLKIEVFNAGKR